MFQFDFQSQQKIKAIYKNERETFSKTKGKIIIENIDETSIKGKFEFTSDDGISVTKGEFYLPLKKVSTSVNFPMVHTEVNTILTPKQKDNLKKNGMQIHDGDTPPNVSGIYQSSPHILFKPYGAGDHPIGYQWPNFIYKISEQKNGVATLDYKSATLDETGYGNGIYVTGSGNLFTLYSRANTIISGVKSSQTILISGEMSSQGIKNLKSAYILTWKEGDLQNKKVMPIGAFRISGDKDNMSERISNF